MPFPTVMVGRRRLTRAILLASALAAITPAVTSAQPLILYDDFAAPRIDRDRWRGYAQVIGYARPGTVGDGWSNVAENPATTDPARSAANELAEREIASGQLRLALTTHGAASASRLVPGYGRLGVTLRDTPAAVTRAQVAVTVADATAEPCGTEPGRTRAQLVASGSGGLATLSLQRGTHDGDQIVAVVSRCRAASCAALEDVGWIVFDRAWTEDVRHVLTITEQVDRSRFVFSVSGGTQAAETRAIAYPPVASPSPGLRGIDLRVENHPAFCPASGEDITRARATMDARFDNLRLNATTP